jgi:tRNA wybutosine-synthesizing protein 1
MDLGESGAWPVVLADWIDRSLKVWHEHRVLFAGIALAIICVILGLRKRHTTLQRAKRDASPSAAEKAPWPPSGSNGKNMSRQVSSTSPSRPSVRTAAPRVVTGRKPMRTGNVKEKATEKQLIQPLVFYASLTGTAEKAARHVVANLQTLANTTSSILQPTLHDLSYIDLDDYFISGPRTTLSQSKPRYFYILVIPSYDIDTILSTVLAHLDETHNDFRIDTAPLSTLAGYSVFGIGDKEGWPSEEKGFCSQAVEMDRWMAKLTGRKRAYPLGMGDVKGQLHQTLDSWCKGVSDALQDLAKFGFLGEGVLGSGDAVESDLEDEEEFPDRKRNKRQKLSQSQAADLEDVGGKSRAPLAVDFTTSSPSQPALKAMVPESSPTYTALTKQGYTIVGSHSGVKICRWTKSALRGRGSCYKNSFYGIASHLCMETTPSLSCSNKCVFCWRHGTNPVSTTWRWQVDDPQMIFDGAKEGHYKKIKMMRGVPGVRSERFEEAMKIRHCALSLVGEPIFYPRINEFVDLLHGEQISSFLVCNAQHPQQLRDLKRVTQLYVSIDASNKDSLRKIDRPLHRDFWERFQECLDILKEKQFIQRTVFRLTLVKGFNVEDEAEGYADLVMKGLPCFVEVKGVTYCGTSSSASAGLTMQNVPFYEEVVQFVEALDAALAKRGLEYGIAAEHEHSCCILLASKRFLFDGKWHTIIDYERFFELLGVGGEFGPEDYCKPTPEWALWGNGGFDPRDERVDRKGRPKDKPVRVREDEVVPAQAGIEF